MSRKRVLIISYSWLYKDPRVLVQYDALKNLYEIETLGFAPINDNSEHYPLYPRNNSLLLKPVNYFLLATGLFSLFQKIHHNPKKYLELMNRKYDLIICNDLASLPIGDIISNKKIPIWSDLHEYSPKEFENSRRWRFFYQRFIYWCGHKYLPIAQRRSTVCKGLLHEYEKTFNVKVHEIIFNAPKYTQLEPSLIEKTIKLVHHGGAQRERKIENMLELMELLGTGYSLDFYLMAGNEQRNKYLKELKDIVNNKKLNVRFNDPVNTTDIPNELNKYDLGIFILEPINFNYLHALPNKVFEYVQARLGVVVSPNPEMKNLVEEHQLGVVAKNYSPKAMADAIGSLSHEDIMSIKVNSDKKANSLSSKRSIHKIQNLVLEVLN